MNDLPNANPSLPTSEKSEPAPQSAAAGLQFDQVEHAEGVPSELGCVHCKQPIRTDYWEVTGQPMCTPCRLVLEQYFVGKIPFRTWGRILAYGGGAALLGTLIYFTVLKLTGYEIGLIAIVVGLLVGNAVRKASGFRGGWKLQAVAMALTYASIVSSYIPGVYSGIMAPRKKAAAETSAKAASAPRPAASTELPANLPAEQGAAAIPMERDPAMSAVSAKDAPTPLWKLLGSYLLFGVILFLLAAAAPILAGFHNFMGWIIIAIALYEAWKLNRRVPFVVRGPLAAPVTASPGTAAAPRPAEPATESLPAQEPAAS